ncbi:hypothetical protein H0H93_004070 [Arthromyces matolae]|nr:hypothetical protein H0H93_004070 [Arthromyces matolae]
MDETRRLVADPWTGTNAANWKAALEGTLLTPEIFWRDHYEYLKGHGYTLRRRYEPDWSPSWIAKGISQFQSEDGNLLLHGMINDATKRDGSYVVLKIIDGTLQSARDELTMVRFLSSPDLSINPRNRCVPILEVIPPMEGSNVSFLVMPLLFDIDRAPFETIGEAVEYFRQLFEVSLYVLLTALMLNHVNLKGLQFMHNRNIAHGSALIHQCPTIAHSLSFVSDCKITNIMADYAPLYSHPPHPVDTLMRRDYRGPVPTPGSRTLTPIKYYFIDFDLSEVFGPDDVRLRIPPWGGDRTVPEHKLPHNPPCDPFPVDVYCLGSVIRRNFLDGWTVFNIKPKEGFEFIRELISDMVKDNPQERPTMDEVVARYDDIINGLGEWELRSPVVNVGKSLGIFGFIGHWLKHFVYHLRGIPAIPRA